MLYPTELRAHVQYSNLIRYVPSGIYYARFRVKGKLLWKSLKTKTITTAKMRLADLEKKERAEAEKGRIHSKNKILIEDAIKAYRENGFRPVEARNKDAKALKPAAIAYYEQKSPDYGPKNDTNLAQSKSRKLPLKRNLPQNQKVPKSDTLSTT